MFLASTLISKFFVPQGFCFVVKAQTLNVGVSWGGIRVLATVWQNLVFVLGNLLNMFQ